MTNNKLTATVEHLIDAVGHWQQDYDSKEDSEQYDFFGQLSAALRELQERRKAAMGSDPVELPLDYLQGHKDGLEWAAQLAKANHPETGDWLYDDPIKLAKAIRKGPDMPPAPLVPEEHQRLRELYHAQEKRLFKIAQRIKGASFDKYAHTPSQAIDVLEEALFGNGDPLCHSAMLEAAQ